MRTQGEINPNKNLVWVTFISIILWPIPVIEKSDNVEFKRVSIKANKSLLWLVLTFLIYGIISMCLG